MRSGAILLMVLAAATPAGKYFRYERVLTVPAATGAGTVTRQACAVLDRGLYAHAAPGLADVRLYRTDADMRETPYVIQEEMPAEAQLREAAPLNLGHKGAHTTFEVAMPEGRYSDVELDIRRRTLLPA